MRICTGRQFVAACFLGAAISFLSSAVQAGAPSVKIATGTLSGRDRDGVISYLGIPYAAPPVGALRWRPPQAAAAWRGIRQATAFGPECPQLPIVNDTTTTGRHSEDCLYINVWRPAGSARQLPVMVWLHGGGFVNGGSSSPMYDGAAFARQGVVLVTLNYRLGRFGFFAFPALSREHPEELKGNYGYMDQIAALKWVQRNVAAFGGDAHNVTIFGESAGGGSVHALLTSPLTAGLFHKAIIESGGGRGSLLGPRKLDQGTDKAPSAETIGLNFAKENGIDGDGPQTLAALRALPAERIVGGLSMQTLAGPVTFAGPMTDGRLVVGDSDEIYRAHGQQKVPVMIGVNDGDIGRSSAASLEELFAPFGPDRDAARAAYDPNKEQKLPQIGHDIAADRGMTEPARLTAQLISDQGLPAYEYRFSYVSPATRAALEKSPFKNVSATDGAKHGSELPFVFDTVSQMLPGASAADEATARAMNAYWANFAKTGNPDSGPLPHWPRYQRSEDMLMNFTADGPKAMPDPWRARLDLTQKYAEQANR